MTCVDPLKCLGETPARLVGTTTLPGLLQNKVLRRGVKPGRSGGGVRSQPAPAEPATTY